MVATRARRVVATVNQGVSAMAALTGLRARCPNLRCVVRIVACVVLLSVPVAACSSDGQPADCAPKSVHEVAKIVRAIAAPPASESRITVAGSCDTSLGVASAERVVVSSRVDSDKLASAISRELAVDGWTLRDSEDGYLYRRTQAHTTFWALVQVAGSAERHHVAVVVNDGAAPY